MHVCLITLIYVSFWSSVSRDSDSMAKAVTINILKLMHTNL